jgi:hypothetical protein
MGLLICKMKGLGLLGSQNNWASTFDPAIRCGAVKLRSVENQSIYVFPLTSVISLIFAPTLYSEVSKTPTHRYFSQTEKRTEKE